MSLANKDKFQAMFLTNKTKDMLEAGAPIQFRTSTI